MCRKLKNKVERKRARVQPRPGRASEGAVRLSSSKPIQAQPLKPAEIPRGPCDPAVPSGQATSIASSRKSS